MQKQDHGKNRIQQQICDSLKEYPGLYSRELSRKMNIPYSTLRYHLYNLEKLGKIHAEHEGKCLHYYLSNTLGSKEEKVLSILRKKTTKQIILLLLYQKTASRSVMSKMLEKHPTTIMFHCKKLAELDIITMGTCSEDILFSEGGEKNGVESSHNSNEVLYRLKEPNDISLILNKYKGSLF